jgi:small subunit ribosomal protein S6
MAQVAPTYDLVLLLDPQAQESARAKILADARQAIVAKGEIVRDDDWGDRALAYPIDHKANAEYHLLQFKTGAPELLGEMSRTLHITDGILRFRIVKLKPGTPDAPDLRAGPRSTDAGAGGAGAAGSQTSAPPPVAETAPAETAPAETAPAETEAAGETQAGGDAPGAAEGDAGAAQAQAQAADGAPAGDDQSSETPAG